MDVVGLVAEANAGMRGVLKVSNVRSTYKWGMVTRVSLSYSLRRF